MEGPRLGVIPDPRAARAGVIAAIAWRWGSTQSSGPGDSSHCQAERSGGRIPVTYVPARNTVFLSLALAFAESAGAFDIFIGANCLDYSGYPDCRPEFLEAFERLANLGTKAGVEGTGRFTIHSPLL